MSQGICCNGGATWYVQCVNANCHFGTENILKLQLTYPVVTSCLAKTSSVDKKWLLEHVPGILDTSFNGGD